MRTTPPPELDRVLRLMSIQSMIHRPRFSGWENIPDSRPLLFVGNHTLMGVLDVPFLFRALWREKGIFLNALGDRFHFHIPVWRRVLRRYGVVEGSRDNCGALFAQGACVLVFPGGAREVCKRKGEEHQLVWGQRSGFARMAIQHGATIVPFAAVGVEDALDIVLDANDMAQSPVGRMLDRAGIREDLRAPVVRGIGPTPIPRPERYDFRFMEPVDVTAADAQDDEQIWAVRELTRQRIEAGIDLLRTHREQSV